MEEIILISIILPVMTSFRRMKPNLPTRVTFPKFVLGIFFFLSFQNVSVEAQGLFGGLCPEKCYCALDVRGRMEIACTQGRMTDIPTFKMSQSTEVIKIIPPESQPNHLTLGRFFNQFKKLEELQIVNSNIPNIGENSFWGSQSLRKLNLAKNNISLIVDANFKGLVSLEELNLSDNKINSFVSASFSALVKLRELDLSRNQATKLVERLFYNLHMLEVLDISGNWLRELNTDVFKDIWRLKTLRCRSCGLKTINPLLYRLLPDLIVLDLGSNEFKYLNRDEFGSLIHLRNLYLDGNQLSAIIDNTFRSQNLYELSLSSNLIARVDRLAFQNTSVGWLDLSGNKFEALEVQIFNDVLLRNLTRLELNRVPKLGMTSLSILLSANSQLRFLSIAENNYKELPMPLFEKLERLEVLNISGNHLADISAYLLTPLQKLRVLDVSGNRLKGIDGEFLTYVDRLHKFEDLRIHGNPFACDLCNIPALLKWIHIHTDFARGCNDPFGVHCLRCTSPPAFYDKALVTLEESMLNWCTTAESASILAVDAKFGLFIGCGVILLILVIASVAIVLHARWHAAHYYTHEDERPEIGTPPLPPDYDNFKSGDGYDNLYFEKNGNKPNMIATIEEIPYEPPHTVRNGGNPKFSYAPKLTSFKVTPTSPDSACSPQPDFL